jgi:hypothetical protein
MGKKMAIATSVAKRVAEAVVGTKPKTDKEKKLAAMSGDKNSITQGDVLKARGVTKEEADQVEEGNVMKYKMSRSGVAGDRGDSKGGDITVDQKQKDEIAKIFSKDNEKQPKK